MVKKIWPGIMSASLATIITLLLFVLNATANSPVYVMADELTADFNAVPSSGVAPLAVHFIYIPVQGGIAEWNWDFGDGAIGNGYNINHTYENPGQYVVTLTIKNGSGSQGHVSKQITVLSGGSVSPSAPVEASVTPSPGLASVIPGIIDTPSPPSATPAPVTATPQPATNANGTMDLGGGITLSEDQVQLIIAGTIAVIIAALIIIFFSTLSKRQGEKKAEKPPVKPPAPPSKPKVKEKAPKPVKKTEDISQDYIYGLVTGKVGSEAERPLARQQNDYRKKN